MYLQELSLINFKNYQQTELKFSPKVNCFMGNNGVGKTNLLDAIYYLSFSKSCFNTIDSQNINYSENFFVVQGKYSRDDKIEEIYCGVKRNTKKSFKRNKKDYNKLSDHIGLLPLVMISPNDSNLIIGGSEERRKLIDGVISQFDKVYLETLIKYNKALSQRNVLLKNFIKSNSFDESTLEIWDEQLDVMGNEIYKKRVEFIEELIPVFEKYYEYVSRGNEKVHLIYQSHLKEGNLIDILKDSREKDMYLQYTSKGIHKDDLILSIEQYPIKKYGSQGQQKTYLVALKLAQFDFIKNLSGKKPILLLDDVFDKLDSTRVKQIIDLVSNNTFGQIFITDTNKERLGNILKNISVGYKLFSIDDSNVTIIEN